MNSALTAPTALSTQLPKGKAFVVLTLPNRPGVVWGYFVPKGDAVFVKGTSTVLPGAMFRPKPKPKPKYAGVPRARWVGNECPHCGADQNYQGVEVEFEEGTKSVIKCHRCEKLMRPW